MDVSPSTINSPLTKTVKRKTKKFKKKKKPLNPELVKEYANVKDLSLEEISIYIQNLKKQFENESQARKRFQLERDKLIELKEIDKKKFEDLRGELLDTHEQLAKLQHEHHQEITILKQKVRYLMNEQELKINGLKLKIEKRNKQNIDENSKDKEKHVLQLRQLVKALNEKEVQYEDMIKNLTIEYENRLSKMRQEYAEAQKVIQKTIESRFNEERSQFNLITRNTVHEITELKNSQIDELINMHNKAYDDLKNYFKDLINNTMVLVNNLREKNTKALSNEKENVLKAKQLEKELKQKIEENNKFKSEFASLKQKSDLYEVEKALFSRKTIECKNINEKHSKLDIKYEMLLNNYNELKKEHDAMMKNIEASSIIFQEKCNNRIFLTNRKVDTLQKDLNRYEDFLKAFNFSNLSSLIDDDLSKDVIETNAFDYHQILYQFRIRENFIEEQTRHLIEISTKYNGLLNIVNNFSYEIRVLVEELGYHSVDVNGYKKALDCSSKHC